jgi:hypothetical protein
MTPEAPGHSPALSSGYPSRAAGAFLATFPIGLDPGGRALVLYLATVPWTDDFRTFLQGTAAFLAVVPSWTLRLVFPRPLDRVYTAYQTVVREELETPLHRATIGELQWYFEHRQKALGQGVHPSHPGLPRSGLEGVQYAAVPTSVPTMAEGGGCRIPGRCLTRLRRRTG